MVIDDYERLQSQQGGVPTTPMQLHANLPEHMEDNTIGLIEHTTITCDCGDRDCSECGRLFLSRHSENQD